MITHDWTASTSMTPATELINTFPEATPIAIGKARSVSAKLLRLWPGRAISLP
jgi:hypothetical protein